MPDEATPTGTTWRPQTPEQEIEFARVLESTMFEALRNFVHKTMDETMARHMAGPVDGFTVPIAATVIKKA
ncbi:hypothetical protein [Acidovorax sp. Leaf73]|uniref:hypothetical protein n=1 Tax=Acidovorax sp. Leaf73 TaxID=2876566 RepID=UPI001E45B1D4|nr:hypothetical protein [Acidovorax sp. Leaf73]